MPARDAIGIILPGEDHIWWNEGEKPPRDFFNHIRSVNTVTLWAVDGKAAFARPEVQDLFVWWDPQDKWHKVEPTSPYEMQTYYRRAGRPPKEVLDRIERNRKQRAEQGGTAALPNLPGEPMQTMKDRPVRGNATGPFPRRRPATTRDIPFGSSQSDNIKRRVNSELQGPQMDLSPSSIEEKKFSARNRLFIGNLPREITEDELRKLFSKYGEVGQVFYSKENVFAFISMDYRINAEKAKRDLQGNEVGGRNIVIRFASITTGVRVRNLTQQVSNELLEKAFSVFGQIESCRVVCDDRGKATGDGIVIFADKKGATLAIKKCQEDCYFLTSALRPVIVEPLEPQNDCDGLPESSMVRNDSYRKEREEGPRFADINSFEFEYGLRWKRLYETYREKKNLLESDLKSEAAHLETMLELVRHEHETERLRRELMAREAEAARLGRNVQSRFGNSSGYEDYFSRRPDSYEDHYQQSSDALYHQGSSGGGQYAQAKRGMAEGDMDPKRLRY